MSVDATRPAAQLARKGRFLPPLWTCAILLLELGALAWLRLANPVGDRGSVNAFSMMLGVLLVLTYLVWFGFGSRFRWWVRWAPLLMGIVGTVAFFQVFRLEQVSGDFIPSFSLRSAERADAHLETPTAAIEPVDLVTTTADDFPQFLGPRRDVAVEHVALARDWQRQPPELLWRQPIGAGWSAFAVVNGFAVTLEQRGGTELVTCYEVATGKLRWSHPLSESRFDSAVAGIGPRATPTIDQGRVYVLGATGRLAALDGAHGALLWEKDLLEEFGLAPEQEAKDLPYGRSGSPLVVGDLVVVPAGGPSDGRRVSLVAYDKLSGEPRWQGGERQISCASPVLATLGGAEQILIVNEDAASGHDPVTGRVLWEHPWEGRSNANASVSQAVALAPDRVLLSKGYGVGAALLELAPRGDGFETHQLWHEPQLLRTKLTNVAIWQGHAYGLSDGILECVELASGRRMWKDGRYRQGQLLRVRDLLVVVAESGEVFLVEASPERPNHVLGSFQAITGKTWNNPALYGPHLLVRNAEEAACWRLPLEATKSAEGFEPLRPPTG